MQTYRWNSWHWNCQCAVLKWEYRSNAHLWHAVLHELTEHPPTIVWRGAMPDAATVPGVLSETAIMKAGYCFAPCKDHFMLSAIQSANPGERCLLFDPGERGVDDITVPMLGEVFSLPDSVSPERATREGWQVDEKPMVDALDVPVASLLFWDGDFVDAQSKRHTQTELDAVFQRIAESLGVSLLRDDEL